tara:strand:- start:199 stop:498 length:300 start_codon:yes stop_codon:yes gene_type:complete
MILLLFIPTVMAEQLTRFSPRPAPTPVCGLHNNIHAALSEDGGLIQATRIDDYHAINLYRHKDGRWALILMNTAGIACILQNGSSWQDESSKTPMKPKS